jgi:hypothetical protein
MPISKETAIKDICLVFHEIFDKDNSQFTIPEVEDLCQEDHNAGTHIYQEMHSFI